MLFPRNVLAVAVIHYTLQRFLVNFENLLPFNRLHRAQFHLHAFFNERFFTNARYFRSISWIRPTLYFCILSRIFFDFPILWTLIDKSKCSRKSFPIGKFTQILDLDSIGSDQVLCPFWTNSSMVMLFRASEKLLLPNAIDSVDLELSSLFVNFFLKS